MLSARKLPSRTPSQDNSRAAYYVSVPRHRVAVFPEGALNARNELRGVYPSVLNPSGTGRFSHLLEIREEEASPNADSSKLMASSYSLRGR